jgi:hypothetical protein
MHTFGGKTERDSLKNKGIDGRTILKNIFNK